MPIEASGARSSSMTDVAGGSQALASGRRSADGAASVERARRASRSTGAARARRADSQHSVGPRPTLGPAQGRLVLVSGEAGSESRRSCGGSAMTRVVRQALSGAPATHCRSRSRWGLSRISRGRQAERSSRECGAGRPHTRSSRSFSGSIDATTPQRSCSRMSTGRTRRRSTCSASSRCAGSTPARIACSRDATGTTSSIVGIRCGSCSERSRRDGRSTRIAVASLSSGSRRGARRSIGCRCRRALPARPRETRSSSPRSSRGRRVDTERPSSMQSSARTARTRRRARRAAAGRRSGHTRPDRAVAARCARRRRESTPLDECIGVGMLAWGSRPGRLPARAGTPGGRRLDRARPPDGPSPALARGSPFATARRRRPGPRRAPRGRGRGCR